MVRMRAVNDRVMNGLRRAENAVVDEHFPDTSPVWRAVTLADRYLRVFTRCYLTLVPGRSPKVRAAHVALALADVAAAKGRASTPTEGMAWRLRTRTAMSLVETAATTAPDLSEFAAAPAGASTAELGFRFGWRGTPGLAAYIGAVAAGRALIGRRQQSGSFASPTIGFFGGLAYRQYEVGRLARIRADRRRVVAEALERANWSARWEVVCDLVKAPDRYVPVGDLFTSLGSSIGWFLSDADEIPQPLRRLIDGSGNKFGTRPSGAKTVDKYLIDFYPQYNRAQPLLELQLFASPVAVGELGERFVSPRQATELDVALFNHIADHGPIRELREVRYRGYARRLDVDVDGVLVVVPSDLAAADPTIPLSQPLPSAMVCGAAWCAMDATSVSSALPLRTVVPGAAAGLAATWYVDRAVRRHGPDAALRSIAVALGAAGVHAAATLPLTRSAPLKPNGLRRTPVTQAMYAPAMMLGYAWPYATRRQRTIGVVSTVTLSVIVTVLAGRPWRWRDQLVNWVFVVGSAFGAYQFEQISREADVALRQMHEPAIEQQRAEMVAAATPQEWTQIAVACEQAIALLDTADELSQDWAQVRIEELEILQRHAKRMSRNRRGL